MAKLRKDPAAVSLGKKGGKASAAVRIPGMTDKDRAEIGRKLAKGRWEKWMREHPEKAAEAEARRYKRKMKSRKPTQHA
jgi:hypothetical protein